MNLQGQNLTRWTPAERACLYWNEALGRSGLTVYSLASLTGRSPGRLLRQLLLGRSRCHWNFCGSVRAPVWFIIVNNDTYPEIPMTRKQAIDNDPYTSVTDTVVYDDAVEECTLQQWHIWFQKKYPWPKYKGINKGEGTKFVFDNQDKKFLPELKKAIKDPKWLKNRLSM